MKKHFIHLRPVLVILLVLSVAACSGKPRVPYTAESTPELVALLNSSVADDRRGRFREILCAVLEEHGKDLPDYQPCEQALTRVGDEPPGTGQPVNLGQSSGDFLIGFVPGFGWDCFKNWLDIAHSVPSHMTRLGYTTAFVDVGGLSGTLVNAEHIRATIDGLGAEHDGKPIILMGYSKGAPDILEFLVNHPQAASRVKAVVSISGAIGGSPLAIGASQSQAEFLMHVPKAECDRGDSGVVNSMLPDVRKQWLAENPLPENVRYYSVVSYPQPERISTGLKRGYNKLAKIDARNDSQVIFYDQVIPGSSLVAFTNADHWAMAVPVDRSHSFIGDVLVNHNDYPREAFFEALLRFLEEDLSAK